MKNFRLFFLVLFFIIVQSAFSQSNPIKIMPLGDSITRGTGSTGTVSYRRALYFLLTGVGYSVDFVGSASDGTPSDFDINHEGHGGVQSEYIRDNIYGWLEDQDGVSNDDPVKIILLHIGTNDFDLGETQTPAEVATVVRQTLDNIDNYESNYNTHITVILAKIINRIDSTTATGHDTHRYNTELQLMADSRKANGDDIIVVDQEHALSYPDDFFNEEHPNDVGYNKLANVWFAAIDGLISLHSPSNLVASTVASDKINLSWADNSSHEQSFEIERSSSSVGPFQQIATVGENVTNYLDTGLSPNTNYFYRVRASNGWGSSDYSNIASATTTDQGGPGGTFVEASGEVVMEAEHYSTTDIRSDPDGAQWIVAATVSGFVGAGYVLVPSSTARSIADWSSGAELSFQINFSTTGTYNIWLRRFADADNKNSVFVGIDGNQVDNIDNGSDFNQWIWKKLGSYTISSIGDHVFNLRRREFDYKVDRIVLSTSETPPSGNGPVESERIGISLNAPSDLVATASSPSSISLTWQDNSNSEDNFEVERGLNLSGPFQKIITLPANTSNYSDSGLNPETEYFYRVRAISGSGSSTYSNVASATTPPDPSIFKFEESGGIVSMESEHFTGSDRLSDPNFVTWQTNSTVDGYIGTGYVDTPPPEGTNGTWNTAAEVTYKINFTTTGTYNIWLKRYAPDDRKNSVFVGLDGSQFGTTDNDKDYGIWVWKNLGTMGVVSAVTHTFSIRRRESQYKVDKIVLMKSSGTPSEFGPPESLPLDPGMGVPSSLVANANTPGSVQLSWTDNSSNEEYFEVMRSTDGNGNYQVIATPGVNSTSYSDINLPPGTQYYYKVRAIRREGSSGDSNTSNTTTLTNQPPIISDVPDQTVDEGENFTIFDLDDYVSDPDHSDAELVWSYSGNQDLSVSVNSNHEVTIGIPNTEWSGSETITFKATDPGGLFDTDTSRFIVNAVNDAPYVASPVGDQSYAEDSGIQTVVSNLDTVFKDPDSGDSLSFSAKSDNANISVSLTGISVKVTPASNYYGTGELIITATDKGGLSASDTFTVTITSVNDAPVTARPIPDRTLSEDFGSVIIADLDTVFSDVDGDQLTFSASSGGHVVTAIDTAHVLNLTSTLNYNGIDTIVVTANDNVNRATVSDTFVVTITPVNDAPVVSGIPDVNMTEDGSTMLDLDKYVSDVDDDTTALVWSSSVLSAGAIEVGVGDLRVKIDSVSHVATMRASGDSSGVFEVEFVARDISGAMGTDTIQVRIGGVNDPPVILPGYPDIVFAEDDTMSLGLTEVYVYVEDPDNADSTLLYSLLGGSDVSYWIESGNIYMTNTVSNWSGRDTVRMVVSDGELSDTAEVNVIVEPVNDVPIISGFPEFVEFSADSSVNLMMWDYVSDVETPDSSLLYMFGSSSDSIRWSYDAKSGELTIGADPAYSGAGSISVKVMDDSGAVDSASIKVTVNPNAIAGFGSEIPTVYELSQNYPNPFNPVTHIRFGLPQMSKVSLEVFNILGQRVLSLINAQQLPAGYHVVDLDAASLPSGVYIYRMRLNNYIRNFRMILEK